MTCDPLECARIRETGTIGPVPHHQTKLALFLHELVQLDSHLDIHRDEFLEKIQHFVALHDSAAKDMAKISGRPRRDYNNERDAIELEAMEAINRQRDLADEFWQLQRQVYGELDNYEDNDSDESELSNDGAEISPPNSRIRRLLDRMEKVVDEKELQGQRFERLVSTLAYLNSLNRPTHIILYGESAQKMIGCVNKIRTLWKYIECVDTRRGEVDNAITKAVLDLVLLSRYSRE